MCALHRYTELSLKEIGKRTGGRDHTTVIHGLRAAKDMLETRDPLYTELFALYFNSRDAKYPRVKHDRTDRYQFNF
jgi:hypothetical protein